VKVHDRILKLVGKNNARVFQSTEASLDEDWVDASTSYVLSTFDCIKALKSWSPYLRPFIHLWLPERTAIKDQWTRARKMVVNSVQRRQAQGRDLESPPSMLDFLSSGKNENLANDIDIQLLFQMTLVAVGTVTTFASITQALYDLATYPEYLPILREEVLNVPMNEDGLFSKESISAMKKLDSFIKESQRLSAPDLSCAP
jgi:cytochrome P450